MNRHEAKFQTKFGRWLQYAYTGGSAAFELKRTLARSLPIADIRPHQLQSLRAARSGLYYKPPDDSRSYKPCDTLFLRGAGGFLAVAYGDSLTGFYLIPIEKVDDLISRKAISIHEDNAKKIGTYHEFKKKTRDPA